MLWRLSSATVSSRWTERIPNTYHYTVIPGEDGQFVQSRYQIPTSGNVPGNKDADGQG